MRNIIKITIILSTLLTIACQNDIQEFQPTGNLSEQKSIDYLSIISSLGYSTDNVIESDSLFLVSDVIVLKKKDLDKIAETPQTKLEAYQTKLPLEKQHIELMCYMDNSAEEFNLLEAVREWNSVPNCNILFSYGSEYISESFWGIDMYVSEEPIWTFLPDAPKYSFIQVAPIVGNSLEKGIISIDTDHTTWKLYSDEEKKWAFVHALGLLIGLKPNDEPDSIMYNRYSDPYWFAFSESDKRDLVSWYPLTVQDFEIISNTSSYQSDIEYLFEAQVTSYKDFEDVTYEYTVYSSSGIQNYTIDDSDCNYNAAKITFLSADTYTIHCTIKQGDTNFATTSITIQTSSDFILPRNSEILLNEEFDIVWACKPGETLECHIEEQLFGSSQPDYEKQPLGTNGFSIKLLDYGYYIISLTKNLINHESKTKEIHIKRFYRPWMSFPEYGDTMEEFDFRLNVFSLGSYNCMENPDSMIVTSHNPPYNIVVGNSAVLQERLHLKLYKKYFRDAFYPPAPVFRGPVTDMDHPMDTVLCKGTSSTIQIPGGKNYRLDVSDGWCKYYGYHAVIIPEDEVIVVY